MNLGKLGKALFEPGLYLYVGRAKNGLSGRIRRHMRMRKKLFWHIDYLLQKAEIEEVWIKIDFYDECRVAREVGSQLEKSTYPLKNFGSSDCRCHSHLFFIPDKKKNLAHLREKIQFQKFDFDGDQV